MNDSKMDQRGNTSTGIVDEASKTINNHFTKIEQLLADVLDVMKLCCEKDTQLSSSPSNRITNSVNSDSPNCSCVAGWSYQKDVFNFLYLSLIRLTDCFKTMDQSDHVEMVIRRFDAEVKRTCELVAVNQLLHSKIRSLADLMLEIFS